MYMELLDDQELLIKRKAKKHFETCLNLLDIHDLSGAIAEIEKAIELQPKNEFFTELSEQLRRDYFCRGPQNPRATLKQKQIDVHDKPASTNKDHSSIDSPGCPRNTKFSLVNGFVNQTTHNDHKKKIKKTKPNQENIPSGKCSKFHSSCEEKHSISSSDILMEEKPEQSTLNDHDKGQQNSSNNDIKRTFWFPNPDRFDIDARFFEEVCKQRESEDCWDTYMELLSDKIQDNDDSDESHHWCTPCSSSSVFERTKAFPTEREEETKSSPNSNSCSDSSKKRSKTEKNFEQSGSPTRNPTEPTKQQNERLYFLNGTGYYGIPPSTSADAKTIYKNTKLTRKPKNDPSENDFYKNLRFYFNVSDSKKTTAATSEVDYSAVSSDSDKLHFASSKANPFAKDEEKEDIPSKKSAAMHPDRQEVTPPVAEEKPHVKRNIQSSRSFCKKSQVEKESNRGLGSNLRNDPVNGAEKDNIPKSGNSSDRRGKKVNKNRGQSQDDNVNQQTTTKTRQTKKNKLTSDESPKENKPILGEEGMPRMTKEEVLKKILNSSTSSQLWNWTLHSGKKIGVALLWMIYYAVIILLITLILIVKCLFGISSSVILCLANIIMSWSISIALKNKLLLLKVQLVVKGLGIKVWLIGFYSCCKSIFYRWYFGIRTLGFKKFFFGSRKSAQTYNLPNSGENAIQQLLLKRNSDPYSILGVPNDASNEDIKKQYRKLAVLVHPDKNADRHAAEAFRVLSGAYDIIGDLEKRVEFDQEFARRQAYQTSTSQNPTRDFTNPRDVFTEFWRQMEEIRESLLCDVCDKRHRRILTVRDVIYARHCYSCNKMHHAKEGDFWKESSYMGFGPSKFYACMEGRIYDISEWGQCQERNGFNLPADCHQVLSKISTKPRHRPPPFSSRMEEDFWRDIFSHQDRYSSDQGNRYRQQRQRRRKRR